MVRRLSNIEWVAALDRSGLVFGEKEKEIVLARTPQGEQLGIRFPGKESARTRKSPKPWDFRPKLVRANETYGEDMSFFDIWDALYTEIEDRKKELEVEARALATLFYRMAHMLDYVRLESPEVQVFAVDGTGTRGRAQTVALPAYWAYAPPQQALARLGATLPHLGGCSLEAFLRYNDLLAWNEDCKYYYRDTKEKKEDWTASGTGRVNNLLTHVTVVGIILGDVSFAKTLGRASQQRGVAPATGPEALRICRPFLSNPSG